MGGMSSVREGWQCGGRESFQTTQVLSLCQCHRSQPSPAMAGWRIPRCGEMDERLRSPRLSSLASWNSEEGAVTMGRSCGLTRAGLRRGGTRFLMDGDAGTVHRGARKGSRPVLTEREGRGIGWHAQPAPQCCPCPPPPPAGA